MKKLFILLLVLIYSTTSLIAQNNIQFSSDIQTLWGVGAPWTNEDVSAGKFLLGTTSFSPSLNAYAGNSSAFANGTISYDAVSNSLDFSLGELWVDYSSAFWGLRVGRQKTAWGKADGIDITNVICPSDMSSFSAITGDDSKLAVDALRFSVTKDAFTVDAYWIPFFTSAALPLNEGNSLKKFIVPSSIAFPVASLGTVINIPVSVGNLFKPECSLKNGEYGIKLSGYFSALDVSLYGYYGWDDNPFFGYEISYGTPSDPGDPTTALPQGIKVNGTYKRMSMVGIDFAIPVNQTVIRAETAFFPQRYFQKSNEKIMSQRMSADYYAMATGTTPGKVEVAEQHNELSALVGLDWMPSGWTITAQYYCDYVFGNIDSIDRSKAYTHGATLSVSKSLVNETLELGLNALMNFTDFDSLINPTVKYSLSDEIALETGAFIFLPGPQNDGKYGAYKDLSTIYIKVKFSL